MSNLVIVALPADDDPVWKVSSEKVPHLTLLFLGDAESNPNVERIVQFVEHAVTIDERGPFYLDVDHRDVLGVDNADVLHFRKDWSFKWVNRFRNQLLQNTDIKTAYESVEQFPEWNPHLTLGYPETPAHEDKMPEYGLHMLRFDRIAVWTGDFDGPSFRLEWAEREEDSVMAMGSMDRARVAAGVEALDHAGVKGMKWGERKSDAKIHINKKGTQAGLSTGSVVSFLALGPAAFAIPRVRQEFKDARSFNKNAKAQKKVVKADTKWEKQIYTVDGAVKVHNAMADHFNARVGTINDKPKYKNLDIFKRPDEPIAKEYMKEVNALTMAGHKAGVQEVHGSSPSGKKVAQLSEDGQSIKIVDADKVKHAAADEEIVFLLKRDSEGKILEMNKAELAVTTQAAVHGEAFVEELKHVGVKGMRWGVRNKSRTPVSVPVPVAPTATSHVPQGEKRKTKVEATGGENHPAHKDAIKVAEARAKLTKSGTVALSNQELRDVANRIQLEQQVKQLVQPRGKRYVTGLLKTQGNQGVNMLVGKQVRKKLAI